MTQKPPKIAIMVQKFYVPGQTFVNRHVRHLFDGHCCVMSERHYRALPDDVQKPVFFLSDAMKNPRDILTLPFALWQNYRAHHSVRVPYGENRRLMCEFLEGEGADVILSEFGSQSMVVADIGREMGLPVFCYFRGRDASFWIQNKARLRAYHQLFPELAGIFAVSQFLLDNLASVGLTHPNAHVVPSGTDVSAFRPGKKDPNLCVAVGRFVGKKYPELTIRAFLKARETHPQARLEMIGAGPKLKAAEALVREAKAEDAVIFHGQKSSDFVAEKLAQASIFIQHSVTDPSGEAEGLPSSIQEAMAAGCAILSTRHAGIPELVKDGETGYLSAELDEAGFAENLTKLLSEPKATAKMGQNARTLAEDQLDYRKLYKEVEAVMKKAIDERPSKKPVQRGQF